MSQLGTYHSGSRRDTRPHSHLSDGRDCQRIGHTWEGSQSVMRPPEVSKSGRLVPPLGPEVHREEGCYLIPASGTIWLYGGSRNHRGCCCPRAVHVWQEMQLLQDGAEAEWEGRNTPDFPLLTLSCFPLVPPMDFNRDKLAKEPRNAVPHDTEQSRGHNKHNEKKIWGRVGKMPNSTRDHVRFLSLSLKKLSQILVKDFKNHSTFAFKHYSAQWCWLISIRFINLL